MPVVVELAAILFVQGQKNPRAPPEKYGAVYEAAKYHYMTRHAKLVSNMQEQREAESRASQRLDMETIVRNWHSLEKKYNDLYELAQRDYVEGGQQFAAHLASLEEERRQNQVVWDEERRQYQAAWNAQQANWAEERRRDKEARDEERRLADERMRNLEAKLDFAASLLSK